MSFATAYAALSEGWNPGGGGGMDWLTVADDICFMINYDYNMGFSRSDPRREQAVFRFACRRVNGIE